MKIATWNVNSIRVRCDRTRAFLERHQPDVLCLQETKVVDESFPAEMFTEMGYRVECFGQRTYNGVAILSREPADDVVRGIPDGEEDDQARLIAGRFGDILVVNVYVPNGTEVGSQPFAYKLRWLERLRLWLAAGELLQRPLLVCGDFNIAPDARDLYDPEGWKGHIHFHPDEHAALQGLRGLGLVDALRIHRAEAGLYTWWDFRGGMFWKDKGLRIDLLLVNEPLIPRCSSVEIDRWERKGKSPSDHAPVLATFTA